MQSEMRSEIYAAYLLTDFEQDPDQITSLVGIGPTEVWRVGDLRIPQAIVRHKENGWLLRSQLPTSAELEEHVDSVLRQLQPGWQIFAELGTQYYAEISCVVTSYGGDTPAISFDRNTVKRIAELHAAIDIDLYVFDD